MNAKLLLLILFASFAAAPAFGQQAQSGDTNTRQILNGELSIRKNSVYKIGDVRLTRAEMLEIAAPYEGLAREIQRGARLKWSAIGVGVTGGALIIVGSCWAMFPALMLVATPGSVRTGLVIVGTGALMGVTSAGLAVASVKSQKRSMLIYNSSNGYDDIAHLSLSPTPGGLGLQLTF